MTRPEQAHLAHERPAIYHVHGRREAMSQLFGSSTSKNRLLGRLGPSLDRKIVLPAAGSDGRLAVVELRHLEGALARSEPGDGALAALAARYVALAGGLAPTPELTRRVGDSGELVGRLLQPVTAAEAYLNFADTQRNPESFWTPEAYLRLRKVKAAYDPHDVIRSNHPVPLP